MLVGVFIDGFRRSPAEGLQLAADMGCDCFQVYITAGEMLAANMDRPARLEFVTRYRELGLQLSATCGDFGLNFGNDEAMREKEPLLREAILQTVDLGASIMTTHIGAVGADPEGTVRAAMVGNLKRLGDFAAAHGVTFATETGMESGETLRGIIEEADTAALRVNFDPANLVMNGFDHLEAARLLAPYIVHTHAKDGVRVDGAGREVPLGAGQVDFPVYVSLLQELGYAGAYVIEREVGEDPEGDIRQGVEFLRSL